MSQKTRITALAAIFAITTAQSTPAYCVTQSDIENIYNMAIMAVNAGVPAVFAGMCVVNSFYEHGAADRLTREAACYQLIADALRSGASHYIREQEERNFYNNIDATTAKISLMHHLSSELALLKKTIPSNYHDMIDSTRTKLEQKFNDATIPYCFNAPEQMPEEFLKIVEEIASNLVLNKKDTALQNANHCNQVGAKEMQKAMTLGGYSVIVWHVLKQLQVGKYMYECARD